MYMKKRGTFYLRFIYDKIPFGTAALLLFFFGGGGGGGMEGILIAFMRDRFFDNTYASQRCQKNRYTESVIRLVSCFEK